MLKLKASLEMEADMEMMMVVIQVMGRCGVEEVEATIAARAEDLTHQ